MKISNNSYCWSIAVKIHGQEIADSFDWSIESNHLVGRNKETGEWKFRNVL